MSLAWASTSLIPIAVRAGVQKIEEDEVFKEITHEFHMTHFALRAYLMNQRFLRRQETLSSDPKNTIHSRQDNLRCSGSIVEFPFHNVYQEKRYENRQLGTECS